MKEEIYNYIGFMIWLSALYYAPIPTGILAVICIIFSILGKERIWKFLGNFFRYLFILVIIGLFIASCIAFPVIPATIFILTCLSYFFNFRY